MKKFSGLTHFKGILFTMVVTWHTSLFANTITEPLVVSADNKITALAIADSNEGINKTMAKLIQIKLVELTDNNGLIYIAGKVKAADLELYLSQMKKILANDFVLYRQQQSARDHHTFHMTIINPYEYQALTTDIAIGTSLSVSLSGLGRVSKDDKTTYFVVAESSPAANYRQMLALTKKDFHVTLGFYPSDIYGVDKGVASLIDINK